MNRDQGRRREVGSLSSFPLAPASRESSREGPSTVSTCFNTSHRMGLISDQISRNRKEKVQANWHWVDFSEKLTLNIVRIIFVQEVQLVITQKQKHTYGGFVSVPDPGP
jgi:hypothetical protein